MDMSEAVGCSWAIVFELRAAVTACPDLATPDQAENLDTLWEEIGQFAAANAVPPRDWADIGPEWAAAMAARAAAVAPACGEMALPGSDVLLFVQALGNPEAVAEMRRTLSRPRLPVMNPCL